MNADGPTSSAESSSTVDWSSRIYFAIVGALQLIMLVELAFLAVAGRWQHVFLLGAVIAAFLFPVLLRRGREPLIPLGIQIFVVLFVFATVFLGEVRDYYERIWWWDLALHASAGILLGVLGFLVVYILNADDAVDMHMRPSFLALFAFFFSTGLGALWEIFEFGMDQIFGLTMQKPMLDDPSGLTDTMWDLILDAAGAALISLLGWLYIQRERDRFLNSRIRRFIAKHPQFFERAQLRDRQ